LVLNVSDTGAAYIETRNSVSVRRSSLISQTLAHGMLPEQNAGLSLGGVPPIILYTLKSVFICNNFFVALDFAKTSALFCFVEGRL